MPPHREARSALAWCSHDLVRTKSPAPYTLNYLRVLRMSNALFPPSCLPPSFPPSLRLCSLSDLLRSEKSGGSSKPPAPLPDDGDAQEVAAAALPSSNSGLGVTTGPTALQDMGVAEAVGDDGSEPPSLPESMESTPKAGNNKGPKSLDDLVVLARTPAEALALGGQTAEDLRGLDALLSARKEDAGVGGDDGDEESDWDQDMSSHGSFSGRPAARSGQPRAPAAIGIPDASTPTKAPSSSKVAESPQSEPWDTPTPSKAGKEEPSEGSDWDATESPALASLGAAGRGRGRASTPLGVGDTSASGSDWDAKEFESPVPAKGGAKQGGDDKDDDAMLREELAALDDGSEEEEEEVDMDAVADLLGDNTAQAQARRKDMEQKKAVRM